VINGFLAQADTLTVKEVTGSKTGGIWKKTGAENVSTAGIFSPLILQYVHTAERSTENAFIADMSFSSMQGCAPVAVKKYINR
jgi:hypothetical protein